MKIFIGTDSRGYRSDKKNWFELIKEYDSNFVITQGGYLTGKTLLPTIFSIKEEIQSYYDLIILQLGIHELVTTWPKKIWSKFMPETNNFIRYKDNFFFRDTDKIYKVIKYILSCCNNLLIIGMHSWKYGVMKRWQGYKFHESVLFMNDFFSSINDIDYFHMPMDKFFLTSCCYDRLHYNYYGHQIIFNYVVRYISRLNKNINNFIEVKQ
ncbi:MAG: hypothetical protein WC755_02160 [Candidatus Woesearchaeota archaeon]|jgi:hypothetical protein